MRIINNNNNNKNVLNSYETLCKARDNESTLTARKLHTEVEQIALSIDSSSAAAEATMGSIVHL